MNMTVDFTIYTKVIRFILYFSLSIFCSTTRNRANGFILSSLSIQSLTFPRVTTTSLQHAKHFSQHADQLFSYPRNETTTFFNKDGCEKNDFRQIATRKKHSSVPHHYSRRSSIQKLTKSFHAGIIGTLSFTTIDAALWSKSNVAYARGLVRFPCTEENGILQNTYHFMRAGSSLLEEEDVLSSNPLFLTNREAALSEQGQIQIEDACRKLKEDGIVPTIVRYSLAAASIDTANIVGKELKIGRDRLVPEFNFMDPRAVGKWDMLPLSLTESAIWAMDYDEAGPAGVMGRPPPNEDGTPHETLADQTVRLRQLVSVLETQYSGDTILLIFPDGTGPALLSCLIGGIPLNRCHELNFESGEIRLNVTYQNARTMLPEKPSDSYLEKLQAGRIELPKLRQNPESIVNVKDRTFQEELEKERRDKEIALAEKEKKKLLDEREKERMKQQNLEQKSLKKNQNLTMPNDNVTDDLNLLEINPVVAGTILGVIGSISLFRKDTQSQNESLNNTSMTVELQSSIVNSTSVYESDNENLSLEVEILDQIEPVETKMVSGNSSFTNTEIDVDKHSLSMSANVGSEEEKVYSKNKKIPWDPDEQDGGDDWLDMISDIMNED